MKIRVKNWYEYQHRKDVKVMHWFRLNADIASDPKLFKLSVEAKWLWICLLSFRAKEKSDELEIDLAYIEHFCGVKKADKLLESLEMAQLCTRCDQNQNGRDQVQDEQNRTEQDKTEENTTEHSLAELPAAMRLWNSWKNFAIGLPQPQKMTAKRQKSAASRWAEMPDQMYWDKIARKMNESDFCKGFNSQAWKADFDFFIRPDTHVKVLEGKYVNRVKNKRSKNQNLWDKLEANNGNN